MVDTGSKLRRALLSIPATGVCCIISLRLWGKVPVGDLKLLCGSTVTAAAGSVLLPINNPPGNSDTQLPLAEKLGLERPP